jgi:hypothetical protein
MWAIFDRCASAITPTASNTTATRIDGTAAFFIAHLVSSVIYHAEENKEKVIDGETPKVVIDRTGRPVFP